MKTEERNLLLKDLCARLPYQVKVKVDNDKEPYTLLAINANNKICVIGQLFDDVYATSRVEIERIRPFLRKTFNMTDREYKEYIALVEGMYGTGILNNYDLLTEFFNRNHLNYRLSDNLFVAVTKEDNPYENLES